MTNGKNADGDSGMTEPRAQQPTVAELDAAKFIVDALSVYPEYGIYDDEAERLSVSVYLKGMDGHGKYRFLTMLPNYLWAMNLLDNHGLQHLKGTIDLYDKGEVTNE